MTCAISDSGRQAGDPAEQTSDDPEYADPITQRVFAWALLAVVCFWGGFELLSAVLTGPERDLDQITVAALRSVDDPQLMIGPQSLTEIMRDFTALGGYAVMIFLITTFAFFLRFQQGPRYSRFFLMTTIGGYVCSMAMKSLVGRVRPGLVPHLSYVETSSFPSSHSMVSLIVFVTMGMMLSRLSTDRGVRRLLAVVPFLLTGFVGISRVFMGVHYPTDVLAGWTAGILWTWAAFTLWYRIAEQRSAPN